MIQNSGSIQIIILMDLLEVISRSTYKTIIEFQFIIFFYLFFLYLFYFLDKETFKVIIMFTYKNKDWFI